MKASNEPRLAGPCSTGVLATIEARTSILSVDILIRPTTTSQGTHRRCYHSGVVGANCGTAGQHDEGAAAAALERALAGGT